MLIVRLPRARRRQAHRPEPGTDLSGRLLPAGLAAAAPFGLIEAAAGLDIDHAEERTYLRSPDLPPFADWLQLPALAVGRSILRLCLRRSAKSVSASILERSGPASLTILH